MEERVGEGKTAFVVTDRRGEKKPPRQDVVVDEIPEQRREIEATKDKSAWEDVGYIVDIIQPSPDAGMMVRGCAVGLRTDGRTFAADWIFSPVWSAGLDWTMYAKKRLDTYLNCECIEGTSCSTHRREIPQWMQNDAERLQRISADPLPAALEAFLRSKMAKQNTRIVAPGR